MGRGTQPLDRGVSVANRSPRPTGEPSTVRATICSSKFLLHNCNIRQSAEFFCFCTRAMQALMLRALCRTPKQFKAAPVSISQQFSSYNPNYMFSSAKQQPQSEMENRVFFSGEEDIQQGYRDDEMESYGIAYATRCCDEGYGDRYGESVSRNWAKEDMTVSFGLAHATSCSGEGYKEGYEESLTLSNKIVGSEDMEKSFGLAYATRCFDEGYGDRYGESVEVGGKCGEGIKVLGSHNLEKKDIAKSFELAYPTRCFDKSYNGRHGDPKVDEEDMIESFGLAYATRCSDEGYGDRYGESIKVLRHRKNTTEIETGGHY